MSKLIKLLAASSGVALAFVGASPAFAAGTASNTSITNQASVTYSVGGVPQVTPVLSNIDSFLVDRKIDILVAEVGTTTTSVSPGQTAAVTTFTVTNQSNATLDLGLTLTQQVGGTAAHGGTDNFDMTGPALYLDDGDGVFDAGDTLITYLDEIVADGVRTVHVVANVPLGQATGSVAGVTMTAQARESGVVGTQGAVSTQTAGANTAAVDTVFADGTGTGGDGNNDGRDSARDDYTVAAAALSVVKTSRVVWDPVNLAVNPKAIPGARIEYCIAVTNAAGGAAATAVAVSDTLVASLAPYGAFGYWTGATVAAGVCSGGTNNGSAAGQVVSGTIGTVNAGTTSGFYFQATVQ